MADSTGLPEVPGFPLWPTLGAAGLGLAGGWAAGRNIGLPGGGGGQGTNPLEWLSVLSLLHQRRSTEESAQARTAHTQYTEALNAAQRAADWGSPEDVARLSTTLPPDVATALMNQARMAQQGGMGSTGLSSGSLQSPFPTSQSFTFGKGTTTTQYPGETPQSGAQRFHERYLTQNLDQPPPSPEEAERLWAQGQSAIQQGNSQYRPLPMPEETRKLLGQRSAEFYTRKFVYELHQGMNLAKSGMNPLDAVGSYLLDQYGPQSSASTSPYGAIQQIIENKLPGVPPESQIKVAQHLGNVARGVFLRQMEMGGVSNNSIRALSSIVAARQLLGDATPMPVWDHEAKRYQDVLSGVPEGPMLLNYLSQYGPIWNGPTQQRVIAGARQAMQQAAIEGQALKIDPRTALHAAAGEERTSHLPPPKVPTQPGMFGALEQSQADVIQAQQAEAVALAQAQERGKQAVTAPSHEVMKAISTIDKNLTTLATLEDIKEEVLKRYGNDASFVNSAKSWLAGKLGPSDPFLAKFLNLYGQFYNPEKKELFGTAVSGREAEFAEFQFPEPTANVRTIYNAIDNFYNLTKANIGGPVSVAERFGDYPKDKFNYSRIYENEAKGKLRMPSISGPILDLLKPAARRTLPNPGISSPADQTPAYPTPPPSPSTPRRPSTSSALPSTPTSPAPGSESHNKTLLDMAIRDFKHGTSDIQDFRDAVRRIFPKATDEIIDQYLSELPHK